MISPISPELNALAVDSAASSSSSQSHAYIPPANAYFYYSSLAPSSSSLDASAFSTSISNTVANAVNVVFDDFYLPGQKRKDPPELAEASGEPLTKRVCLNAPTLFEPLLPNSENSENHRLREQATIQKYAKNLFAMAVKYDSGDGVAQDKRTALKLYEQAAVQGHAGAQFAAGNMYYYEDGVDEDQPKALKLYEQAAAQGHPGAQFAVALMYENGDGVAQDMPKAIEYYRRGALKGDSNCIQRLEVLGLR